MSNLKKFKHEWVWVKNVGSNFANLKYSPMKEHESILVFGNKICYNPQRQPRVAGSPTKVYTKNIATKSSNVRQGLHKSITKVMSIDRVPSSVQKFNIERGFHPTQKPVEMLRYFVRSFSNQNEIVLDNCMGSGSTGVAALLENRKFIGIEKDKNYFNIAKQRIKAAKQGIQITKNHIRIE